MGFAASIWLVGIVPWAALTVWLLRGHPERARVPFLQLWPTDVPRPRSRRSWRRPPLGLLLLLLSALLALVAAAGPFVCVSGSAPLTIIVDRDVTMSAMQRGSSRLERFLRAAQQAVGAYWNLKEVQWVTVPSGELGTVSSLRTAPLLRSAVRAALDDPHRIVVVLSDQVLDFDDERLIRIGLADRIRNVGIVHVAVRESPSAQLLVRVRNQSEARQAQLICTSEGRAIQQEIDLPELGAERDYFMDLAVPGQIVLVRLAVDDDLPADNQAWLVRRKSWPIIESRAILPVELSRMLKVYQKLRPSRDESMPVVVTDAVERAPSAAPAAIIGSRAGARIGSMPVVRVEEHPITRDVDWTRVLAGALAAQMSDDGWRALVRADDAPILAVRESPVKQVWVGLQSESWSGTSDFVIFWTNVLDWLGQGADDFVSERMQPPGEQWSYSQALSGTPVPALHPPPGIYRRADGELRAFNVLDIRIEPPPAATANRLRKLAWGTSCGLRLAGVSAMAALVCAALSSLKWASAARRAGAT